MATVIRTSLRTILQRLKDKIVAELIPPGSLVPIPSERVLISIRRKTLHMQADNDIVLRPKGFRVDSKVTNYAGRVDTRIIRKLEVVCRSRLDLDDPSRDEIHLLDADLGHVALEEATANCLQEAFPTVSDTDENGILCCPMLMLEGSDPAPESESSTSGGWIQTSLMFEMQYMMAFTEYPS